VEFLKRFLRENPILVSTEEDTYKQEFTGQKKALFKKCSTKK
tara:strand:+ start:654 stop:779 length:126 start_codon:yes stop_codon:yes gene_type:complete